MSTLKGANRVERPKKNSFNIGKKLSKNKQQVRIGSVESIDRASTAAGQAEASIDQSIANIEIPTSAMRDQEPENLNETTLQPDHYNKY